MDKQKKKNEEERIKSIKSHVYNDDYFGTLATVISLIHQKFDKHAEEQEKYINSLKRLENDLMFLQVGYKINKRKIK